MKLCNEAVHKKNDGDDNLIPLINVVFLMLIFFMVAGQIQKSDAIKLQPPSSVSEIPHTEDRATILVDMSGDLYLDNQLVDEDGLKAGLDAAFAKSETPDEFSVLVKVDSTLPVNRLQNVLKLVKSVGLMKVSLATRRGGETS